jgi:uncharacterized OB-fold protein
MSRAESNLDAFAPDIFTGEGAATRLIGSRCAACGKHAFPYRDRCADDGVETQRVELGHEAELYVFTIVRTKAPFGLPQPYAVGYVDLAGEGLRLFMPLDPACIDDFRIGMKLRLSSGPLGLNLNGAPCVRPYFTPALTEG